MTLRKWQPTKPKTRKFMTRLEVTMRRVEHDLTETEENRQHHFVTTRRERKRAVRLSPNKKYPRFLYGGHTLSNGDYVAPFGMTCHSDNDHMISCGQKANEKSNSAGCPCWCHSKRPRIIRKRDTWQAEYAQ